MGSRATIRVEPFRDQSGRRQLDLRTEDNRMGDILDARVAFEIGAVATRPPL